MLQISFRNEIELCRNCGGTGILLAYDKDDLLNYKEPEIKKCPICEGQRVVIVKKEIKTTVIPYSDNEFNKIAQFKTTKK